MLYSTVQHLVWAQLSSAQLHAALSHLSLCALLPGKSGWPLEPALQRLGNNMSLPPAELHMPPPWHLLLSRLKAASLLCLAV